MVRGHVTGLEMHLRGAVVVASDEAEQNLGKKTPLLTPEPTHDAEIDGDKAPGVVDKQISRMHVGVKEPIAQRMAQERLDHRAREMLEIETFGFEARTIRERNGFDPFEREHVAGGAVPVHGRNAEIRIVAGILGHFGERGGFEPQVHLQRHCAAQCVHHFHQSQAAPFGRNHLAATCCEGECIEIDLEAPLNAGPEHFDRHRAAVKFAGYFGAVHLGDRGGRHRRAEGSK